MTPEQDDGITAFYVPLKVFLWNNKAGMYKGHYSYYPLGG
jgi:hypothetical protein